MVLIGVPERVRDYGDTPRNDEGRVPHEFAMQVAEDLKTRLSSACQKIEIAGSLRRGREYVKDIELLCVPEIQSMNDLFGDPVFHRDFLEELLEALLWADYMEGTTLVSGGLLEKRSNSKGHFTYGPLNKYLIHRPTGISVDIFMATLEYWGMSFVIRTGPADFNKAMMTRFKQSAMQGTVSQGVIGNDGDHIECPDEETVFRLLGWDYLEPKDRIGKPTGKPRLVIKNRMALIDLPDPPPDYKGKRECGVDGCEHRRGDDPEWNDKKAKNRAVAIGEENAEIGMDRRQRGLSLSGESK